MRSKADTEAVFRYLDATLPVTHVKSSQNIQLVRAKALENVDAR
jgi:hypothetical protein